MLVVFCVEPGKIGDTASSPEPAPPVANISVVADVVGSPTVVGVTDEVVVVPQGDAQAAVVII